MQLYKRRLSNGSSKLLSSQTQYSGVDVQTFKTIQGSRVVFYLEITQITGSLNVFIANGSFAEQEFQTLHDKEYTTTGTYTVPFTDVQRLFSLVKTADNATYSLSATLTDNSSSRETDLFLSAIKEVSQNRYHTITEVVNSSTTYIGKTAVSDEDENEPVWQIQRVRRIGNTTTVSFADNGEFINAWSERVSLFEEEELDNVYSTQFNGINQYVNFGDSFTDMDAGTQWSMSFWVWIDNVASQRCIYGKVTTDVNVYGFSLNIATSGKLFIQARVPSYLLSHTGDAIIPTQQWVHIVVTYAGGNNFNGIKTYINAVADTPGSSGAMGATLHLGQNALFGLRGAAFPFSGYMDEVSFWNKALSPAEVAQVYNSDLPEDVRLLDFADSLTHFWRMGDGDAVPWILDHQGTTNGAIVNGATFETFVT